jgi:hypothetical protein
VEGSCEHSFEPSGSIKHWEVLVWLHNWRLLKKGSAPRVSKSEATFGRAKYIRPTDRLTAGPWLSLLIVII